MTPDDLVVIAKLATIGLREVERRDGRDYALRVVVERLDVEARAARFVPSMVASVTSITEAPSLQARCDRCGRPPADRLRKGLCDRCRMRARRAGNAVAG